MPTAVARRGRYAVRLGASQSIAMSTSRTGRRQVWVKKCVLTAVARGGVIRARLGARRNFAVSMQSTGWWMLRTRIVHHRFPRASEWPAARRPSSVVSMPQDWMVDCVEQDVCPRRLHHAGSALPPSLAPCGDLRATTVVTALAYHTHHPVLVDENVTNETA